MKTGAKRALKLAGSCRALAKGIEKGRQGMSRFGRSYAFRDSGAPCCPFGHAVAQAGLRPDRRACGPRRGTPCLPYEGNIDTFMALIDKEPGADVMVALDALALGNDALTGEQRHSAVVRYLNDLAAALEAQYS